MSLPDSSIFVPGYDLPSAPVTQHEWDLPESIPRKSSVMDYGYFIKEKAIGCTRRELIEAMAQRQSEISFVWTPETTVAVRPEQVPFLTEAFRRIEVREARKYIGFGTVLLAVGLVTAFVFQDESLARDVCGVVGGFLLAAGNWKYWASRKYTQEDAVSDASAARFAKWIEKRSRSGYAITIIASLVVVSIFYGVAPDSMALIGLVKPAVWRGEVWRLFTAPFVHVSFNHLWMSAAVLFHLSRTIEQTIHRAFVPLLFLASAVVGSVFSVVFDPHTTSIAGNGGIMGLLGFVTIAAYLDRTKYPPPYFKRLLAILAILFALPLLPIQYIDNAAQLGGLVTGATLGLLCVKRKVTQVKGKFSQLAGAAGVLGVIFAGAVAIYHLLS
jgi:membrane associated rhomboid family serine protease